MKVSKKQLQEIIKKEVLKQKRLIELNEKKETLLKKLHEMEYPVEENYLEEEESIIPASEIENGLSQILASETQEEESIEEGIFGDMGSGIKKISSVLSKVLKPDYLKSLLKKVVQTPEQEAKLKQELQKFQGMNPIQIYKTIKPALSSAIMEESMKKVDVNYVLKYAGLGGILLSLISMIFTIPEVDSYLGNPSMTTGALLSVVGFMISLIVYGYGYLTVANKNSY